jgi:hypothetical protein
MLTREFELHARRNGPVFPTAESLAAWAEGSRLPGAGDWAAILAAALCGPVGRRPSRCRLRRPASSVGRTSGRGFARPEGLASYG